MPFVRSIALATLVALSTTAAPAKPPAGPTDATMLRDIRQKIREYPPLVRDPHFRAAYDAIAGLDRRDFVPDAVRPNAYVDLPLSIGYGQTISDPYIVAVMTAAVGVAPGMNVLEIGTGSGYQAAVLSRIGATVHSVEIVEPLAAQAAERLRRLGHVSVSIRAGDGFAGWPEAAPFDAIIVTAGAAAVPAPLLDQLKPGGKLIMPVGANTIVEQLILLTKQPDGGIVRCSLGPAMFVPLTGRGGVADQPGIYDRGIALCYHGQTARWPGQPVG